MLALGLLSFLQITCIPGYLCLQLIQRSTPEEQFGRLQSLVYSFALSLIFNFCVVYTLATMEFYHQAMITILVCVETAGLLWILKSRGFQLRSRLNWSEWSRECVENLRLNSVGGSLAFGLGVACILSFGYLYYRTLGTVFTLWDDTVSWDRWAEEWMSNRFPTIAGYYPQLLPTNWSLSYVMLGTADVKMFAKAVMPLFPIMSFLLFLDLAWKHKAPRYLFSIAIYGSLLYLYLGDALIVSGYMETALPFFGLLAVYSLLDLSDRGPSYPRVLLASVFAASTGLVKQGGLFLVVVGAVWIGWVLSRHRAALKKDGRWRPVLAASFVGFVVVLPWYLRQYLNIASGNEASNVSYLAALTAQGKGHLEVLIAAAAKLYYARGGFMKPMSWFLAGGFLLSVFQPEARRILLGVLAPVLLLWGLFFSYEIRTASLAFPFMAFCSGAGLSVLLEWIGLLPAAGVKPAAPGRRAMFAVGVAAVIGLFLILNTGRLRDAVSFGWQPDMMREVARWWAVPLALSAILLVAVGALAWTKRQWRTTVNWYYPIAAGIWLWLGTTTDRTPDIVRRQVEMQKNIDEAGLNHKLYDFMSTEGIHGKIATDYWVVGRLPVLKQFYQPQYFPDNTSPELLATLTKEGSGVCYVLLLDSELGAPAKAALAHGLYRTIFIEGSRRFVKTCGESPVSH